MQVEASGEIDLLEPLTFIWDLKWLIGPIVGISPMLSKAGALILVPSLGDGANIAALGRTQIAGSAPLNNTPGISQRKQTA